MRSRSIPRCGVHNKAPRDSDGRRTRAVLSVESGGPPRGEIAGRANEAACPKWSSSWWGAARPAASRLGRLPGRGSRRSGSSATRSSDRSASAPPACGRGSARTSTSRGPWCISTCPSSPCTPPAAGATTSPSGRPTPRPARNSTERSPTSRAPKVPRFVPPRYFATCATRSAASRWSTRTARRESAGESSPVASSWPTAPARGSTARRSPTRAGTRA